MVNYLLELLPGLPVSLSLTVAAIIIALVIAIIFTLFLTLRTPIVASLIKIYIILFTGTPLFVQIFLIYYGPGQFDSLRSISWLWLMLSQPWLCAMVALALNSAAYSTRLLFGAMLTITNGQWQACSALGMNSLQSIQLLMPFAIKRALSSYTNEVVLVFKGTSLAYTITLMDVMGQSQLLYGRTYDVMVFGAAGIIYLCVNGVITILMNCLERQALRFEHRNYSQETFLKNKYY